MADSECPDKCRWVFLAMIRVSAVSKVNLASSVVLMKKVLNSSHSGVFRRELRRMNAMTLALTVNFMAVRRDSEVRSEAMCSKTPELPSQATLKSS